jgi:hypothetical protein
LLPPLLHSKNTVIKAYGKHVVIASISIQDLQRSFYDFIARSCRRKSTDIKSAITASMLLPSTDAATELMIQRRKNEICTESSPKTLQSPEAAGSLTTALAN